MAVTQFSQNINLAENVPVWNRTFQSRVFDIYTCFNSKTRIKHHVNNNLDEFIVEKLQTEYNGCYTSSTVILNIFNDFQDAVNFANQHLYD